MAIWHGAAFAVTCAAVVAAADYGNVSRASGVAFGALPLASYAARFAPSAGAAAALLPDWGGSDAQDANPVYVFRAGDIADVSAAQARKSVLRGDAPGAAPAAAAPLPVENGIRVRRGSGAMAGALCVRRALEKNC